MSYSKKAYNSRDCSCSLYVLTWSSTEAHPMKVIDQDTGKPFDLFSSDELEQEIEESMTAMPS